MVLMPGLAPRDIPTAFWDAPVRRGDVMSQRPIGSRWSVVASHGDATSSCLLGHAAPSWQRVFGAPRLTPASLGKGMHCGERPCLHNLA
jgi:hypothetical protein